MKKSFVLLALLLIPITSCSNSSSNTSDDKKDRLIQKLYVDDSEVSKFYYVGDTFSLSNLVVKVLTFKDNAWDEGEIVKDYTSTIADKEVLDEEGEFKVIISYQSFVSHSFNIDVVDKSKYKTNSDFSYALTNINGTDLNMGTLGNNSNGYYLDPLGENNRVLVVPYYFTDQEELATEENRQKIEDTFFASKEEAIKNDENFSVKSYYEESSFNKTTFEGDVVNWFPANVSSEDFTNGGVSASRDIYERYNQEYSKENHGFLGENAKPWSYYDGNNDGVIDLLWIIYSKDRVEGGTDQWWAYTSHDGDGTHNTPSKTTPIVKTFCWASFSFMWGKRDPHTFIHETGHAFGLTDYYDYNNYYSLMGKIDMMDNNIGDHNSFSKFSLGWINPLVVDETSIITLKPYATSGEAIILPSNNYNNTAFDEYLILEYSTPEGLNSLDYYTNASGVQGYTKSGLKILHVDARTIESSINSPLENADDIVTNAKKLAYDNSYFGRNSNGSYLTSTTDYFEASNNSSGKARSYGLCSIIPASYTLDRNVSNTVMTLDNSALFTKGSTFSFEESYVEFMPSYSSMWNKARSHEGDDVVIDTSNICDYTVIVRDLNEEYMTLEIKRG